MAMKAAHKMKVDPHSGRMVSAKSKTGDPACSAATSAWVLGRKAGNVAATVYAVLAKCRAKARQNRQATLKQHSGKLAAGRGTWQRSEKARALVAERAGKRAAQAPSARERVARQIQETKAGLAARTHGYSHIKAVREAVGKLPAHEAKQLAREHTLGGRLLGVGSKEGAVSMIHGELTEAWHEARGRKPGTARTDLPAARARLINARSLRQQRAQDTLPSAARFFGAKADVTRTEASKARVARVEYERMVAANKERAAKSTPLTPKAAKLVAERAGKRARPFIKAQNRGTAERIAKAKAIRAERTTKADLVRAKQRQAEAGKSRLSSGADLRAHQAIVDQAKREHAAAKKGATPKVLEDKAYYAKLQERLKAGDTPKAAKKAAGEHVAKLREQAKPPAATPAAPKPMTKAQAKEAARAAARAAHDAKVAAANAATHAAGVKAHAEQAAAAAAPPPPAVHADVAATVARAKAATLRQQAAAHRETKGTREERLGAAHSKAQIHHEAARARTDKASLVSGSQQDRMAKLESVAARRTAGIGAAHHAEQLRLAERRDARTGGHTELGRSGRAIRAEGIREKRAGDAPTPERTAAASQAAKIKEQAAKVKERAAAHRASKGDAAKRAETIAERHLKIGKPATYSGRKTIDVRLGGQFSGHRLRIEQSYKGSKKYDISQNRYTTPEGGIPRKDTSLLQQHESLASAKKAIHEAAASKVLARAGRMRGKKKS
jgi:hypothetical protein